MKAGNAERTSGAAVPGNQVFWLGDRVSLNGQLFPDDATVVDVVLDSWGAALLYTVRTDAGAVREVPPDSLRPRCVYARHEDAETDGRATPGFPMTTEAHAWLAERLDADTALMAELLGLFATSLMWAETDRLPGRSNYRMGHRPRVLRSHVGKIRLLFPRVRDGTYFPWWLVEPGPLADRVLFPFVRPEFVTIVRDGFLEGISTNQAVGIIDALGIRGIRQAQAGSVARVINDKMSACRGRRLRQRPHPRVWIDARTQSIREGGRPHQVACVIVAGGTTGREILDVDVISTLGRRGWLALLGSLVDRGLHGVTSVVSEYHQGLEEAVAATMPGASWLPCSAEADAVPK